eukprot:Nk52_evm18s2596 gene=Nk52_evmTU18s2596
MGDQEQQQQASSGEDTGKGFPKTQPLYIVLSVVFLLASIIFIFLYFKPMIMHQDYVPYRQSVLKMVKYTEIAKKGVDIVGNVLDTMDKLPYVIGFLEEK